MVAVSGSGCASTFKDAMNEVSAEIKYHVAYNRESSRLNRAESDAQEQASFLRGVADAREEIVRDGNPRLRSIGSGRNDNLIAGEYGRGYFRVVRHFEDWRRMARLQGAWNAGKARAFLDYLRSRGL